MRYFSRIKVLALLAFCIIMATQAKSASALTVADFFRMSAVLGEAISNPFPFPNASLVKDQGTIYFISGTTKVPFTNWKAFTGLGYKLKDVVSGDLSNYSLSTGYTINTANAEHPWSSWISYKGVIYFSTQDGLIPVPSADVFLSNGGKWNLVIKANKYDIAALKKGGSLGNLTLNDSRVGGQTALQFSTPTVAQNNPAPAPVVTPTPVPTMTPVLSLNPLISFPKVIYASSTTTFKVVTGDTNFPLVYDFVWGDGTSPDSATVGSADHTYTTPGTYTMVASVTDGQKNVYSSSTSVTVILRPSLNPSLPQIVLPTNPVAGKTTTVSANSTDPQGFPLTFTFSWGDGAPDTVAVTNSADHVYYSTNSYFVKVTASDPQGYSSTNSTYLTVVAP